MPSIPLKFWLIGGGTIAFIVAALLYLNSVKREAFAAGVASEATRVAAIVKENDRKNRAVEKATQEALDSAVARVRTIHNRSMREALETKAQVKTIIEASEALQSPSCDVPQSIIDAKNELRAAR